MENLLGVLCAIFLPPKFSYPSSVITASGANAYPRLAQQICDSNLLVERWKRNRRGCNLGWTDVRLLAVLRGELTDGPRAVQDSSRLASIYIALASGTAVTVKGTLPDRFG